MITVTITKSNNNYRHITLSGHALYADSGQDIICASVSALSINCFNSIDSFCADRIEVFADEDEGFMDAVLEGDTSKEARLLIDSLILGLKEISKQYGSEYISLQIKEV